MARILVDRQFIICYTLNKTAVKQRKVELTAALSENRLDIEGYSTILNYKPFTLI